MGLDRRTLGLGLASGFAALTGGCTLGGLDLVNSLTPGDHDAHKLVDGASYGPDPRQRLDVYGPTRSMDASPVVVFFYGGSWSSGYRQGYAFVGRALASRGFVVVIPDYRLVPQVRFPAFVQDGALAVQWTARNARAHGGDPRRLALSGHSAGAYISAMLALDEQWLGAAGLRPQAVRSLANLAGPYDFYPFDVPASQRAFGDSPDPQATQPIHFARPGAPPAFLAYGTADTTVKPRNSIRLAEALRRYGVEVDLKSYPGLNHVDIVLALSKPFRSRAPVLEDLSDFLHRHT
jgi:acetyl esterase/lipase